MFFLIFIFFVSFGCWIPFLNTPYYCDQILCADFARRWRKGQVIAKDLLLGPPIGVFFIMRVVQKLFGKDNHYLICLMAIINSVGVCFLFLTLNHFFNIEISVCASVIAAFYLVNPHIYAHSLPIESYIFTPLMVAFFFMSQVYGGEMVYNFFLCGFFYGLALNMKQTALLFAPVFLFFCFKGNVISNFSFLLAGIVGSHIPIFLYISKEKVVKEYICQTWVVQVLGAIGRPTVKQPGTIDSKACNLNVMFMRIIRNSRTFFPLILCAIYGLKSDILWSDSFLAWGLIVFLLCSILTLFLKKTFFQHYWVNIIAPFAIFGAIGIYDLTLSVLSGKIEYFESIFIIVLLISIIRFIRVDFSVYYNYSKRIGIRYNNKSSQIWRIHKYVADYLREISDKNDSFLTIGLCSHIMFWADRNSFTSNAALVHSSGIEWDRFVEKCKSNVKYPKYLLVDLIYMRFLPRMDLSIFEQHLNVAYAFDRDMEDVLIYNYDKMLTDLRHQSMLENSIDSSNQLEYLWIESYKKSTGVIFNREGTYNPDKSRVWIHVSVMSKLAQNVISFLNFVRTGNENKNDKRVAISTYEKILNQIKKGGLLEYFTRIEDDKMIIELYAFIGVVKKLVGNDAGNVYKEIADYLEVYLFNQNVDAKRKLDGIRHVLAGAYFHLGVIKKTEYIHEARECFKKCILNYPSHKLAREYLSKADVQI